MGRGHKRSMRGLMSWMHGAEIRAGPSGPEPKLGSGMRSLGARLYNGHCAVCHGAKGDGNGPRVTELSPQPRDFTKGVYEFRSTPSGALPTDEDIWKVISNGLHGTAMVPWIGLSENERWALVAYVESKEFNRAGGVFRGARYTSCCQSDLRRRDPPPTGTSSWTARAYPGARLLGEGPRACERSHTPRRRVGDQGAAEPADRKTVR
jgi:mono/diheme cytochrome c family protein